MLWTQKSEGIVTCALCLGREGGEYVNRLTNNLHMIAVKIFCLEVAAKKITSV